MRHRFQMHFTTLAPPEYDNTSTLKLSIIRDKKYNMCTIKSNEKGDAYSKENIVMN